MAPPLEGDLRSSLARAEQRVEDLEHEVGRLREVIRRIVGYVNSATKESEAK